MVQTFQKETKNAFFASLSKINYLVELKIKKMSTKCPMNFWKFAQPIENLLDPALKTTSYQYWIYACCYKIFMIEAFLKLAQPKKYHQFVF